MDLQEKEIAATYRSIDNPTRIALGMRALTDKSNSFASLYRYENGFLRAYHRTLQTLNALQTARAKGELLKGEPPSPPAPEQKGPQRAHQNSRNEPNSAAPSAARQSVDPAGSPAQQNSRNEPNSAAPSAARQSVDRAGSPAQQNSRNEPNSAAQPANPLMRALEGLPPFAGIFLPPLGLGNSSLPPVDFAAKAVFAKQTQSLGRMAWAS